MPSHEDYLDNLLKDMEKEQLDTETGDEGLADILGALGLEEPEGPEESGEPNEDSVYLDGLSGMSEDEIERMLSAGEETGDEGMDDLLVEADEDVLSMLQDSDDSDLQEIQELLQKSDNDEVVDEDVQALFFGVGAAEESPADKLMAEIEGGEDTAVDSGITVNEEKKRKKEERAAKSAEKKAAKKASREAAKAQKAAAKSEKQAAKAEKKAKTELDTDALDSIVFGAETLGDESISVEEMVGTESPEVMDAQFAELFGTDSASGDGTEGATAGEEDLGIDLASLFGTASDEGSADNGIELGSGADINHLFGGADMFGESGPEAAQATPEKKKEKKHNEKKGILTKLIDFLTEEEVEEPKNENIQLSAENEEIIKDLDKQKGKKKIKKKGKALAKNAANGEENEDEEKPKKKAAKSKPIKEKKPKKEKKTDESFVYAGPKLTFKKVLPVILLGFTIGFVIMIVSNVSIDFMDKRQAKKAFYAGDYYTCFENLYGKDLNESEAVMYGKSESILYIRLWYREYEMFAEEGLEVQALDSLIQTVEDYPELYEYASQWNATQEVYEVYSKIVTILQDKYGLSEVQAMEIADIKRDKEYSKVVTIIANGGSYGSYGGGKAEPETQPDKLLDELPEESGMNQGGFIDNRN